MGVSLYNRALNEMKSMKSAAEQSLFNDKLRKRFNLENPYRFLIYNESNKATFFDQHIARHAKRYNEDDVFVFYGDQESSNISVGDYVKDLSDETEYEVINLVDVTMPIRYEDKVYDVVCTAVYGKLRN